MTLIKNEYSTTRREHLVHDSHLKEGEKRKGPGRAYLHGYHDYKHYHDHSLEEHVNSGELHIDTEVPKWPQKEDEHASMAHHDEIDFNFNFDL